MISVTLNVAWVFGGARRAGLSIFKTADLQLYLHLHNEHITGVRRKNGSVEGVSGNMGRHYFGIAEWLSPRCQLEAAQAATHGKINLPIKFN